MAGVPVNFAIPGESAVASYSWTDIASGLGYVTFYGFKSVDDTTGHYILSKNPSYSDEVATLGTSVDSRTYTEVLDLDFDTSEFKLPQTIEGAGYVQIALSTNGADTKTINYYAIAKLRKWDGVTETEISSGQSREMELIQTTNYGWDGENSNIYLDIPKTVFKKGEILRLSIFVYSKSTQFNAQQALAHSPNNQEDATKGADPKGPVNLTGFDNYNYSKLKIDLPFKINL